MRNISSLFTACLVLFGSAFSSKCIFASDVNKISVQGTAQISVVPDQITINFSITEQGQDIQKLFQALDKKTKTIIKAIADQNVDPKDIQSAEITVSSLRGKEDDGNKIISYEAARSIHLSLRDFSKFDQLLATMINHGVNGIGSVTRNVKDSASLKAQVRTMAIKAAVPHPIV